MAQEEAGSGGGRKGSVPTGSRPTLRHPSSCPAPELGLASGRRLKGGEGGGSPSGGAEKIEALAACSSSGRPLVPGRPG